MKIQFHKSFDSSNSQKRKFVGSSTKCFENNAKPLESGSDFHASSFEYSRKPGRGVDARDLHRVPCESQLIKRNVKISLAKIFIARFYEPFKRCNSSCLLFFSTFVVARRVP